MTVDKNGVWRLFRMRSGLRKAASTRFLRLNTVGSILPFVTGAGVTLLTVVTLKAPADKEVTFNVPIDIDKADGATVFRHHCFYFLKYLSIKPSALDSLG